MKILFPSNPLDLKQVDPDMQIEFESAELVGFSCFLFDHDEFVKSGELKTNLPGNELGQEEVILLRGWMLKDEQYKTLCDKLFFKGYILLNSLEQYCQCHYMPNYYFLIKDCTPKTFWTSLENFQKFGIEGTTLGRNMLGRIDMLLKDYVKSEKGNPDLFILKKELGDAELHNRIERFIEARGRLFNKGIVLREFVPLKKYLGQTNEWRMFFVDGIGITLKYNSSQAIDAPRPTTEQLLPFIEISKQIPSKFFTMDLAEKENGEWIILELGDGQVSGLAAHEEPIKFYNNLHEVLQEK